MPKKKNIKKILIISILLLVVILAVRQLVVDVIERNSIEEKEYNSISDFSSIEEIAKYTGCTYIKEEKSTGDKYDIDIYLKFKYPLYTDEVSNEEYYYRLIALMVEFEDYQNIRLIDEENDIVIAVECNKENKEIKTLLINGNSNYYGTQETLNSIKKYQALNVTEIEIQSEEVKNLIKNDWVTKNVDFGSKESTYDDYDIYFDEGIEVKTIDKKVFNIVFTEKYDKPIVNGIKVNTSFAEIKKILGTPTFNHENYIENKQKDIGYIGYKGKDIYVFFSENEISVYRVEQADTSTGLADAISNFNQNEDIKKFISTVTDMWPDYDEYGTDDSSYILNYALKGIRIVFSPSEGGISIYENYNGYISQDVTSESVRKNTNLIPQNVKLKLTENLVDVYENSRTMIYNSQYGNIFLGQSDYTTDEFKVSITEQQIMFLSVNRKYSNSTLNEKAVAFKTCTDTEFVFANENNQIYMYNAATRNLKNVQDNNQVLVVDNKKIFGIAGIGIYTFDIENQKLQKVIQFSNELTGIYKYGEQSIIIGIKNMGIYRYNVITNEFVTLVEGQDEYKISTIYEDKVFYDDTLIIVK